MTALIGYPGTLAGWLGWIGLALLIWLVLLVSFATICGASRTPRDRLELDDEEAANARRLAERDREWRRLRDATG